MRCLVVGGTGFLGGAIADELVAAGHEVAVLSRGRTERTLPDGVEAVRDDRHAGLSVLAGRRFDWAFDTCAFAPESVTRLLDALGEGLARYVLISSISAYGTFPEPGLAEDRPVPTASEADLAVARAVPEGERGSAFSYGASYGPLKRACEIAAAERLGGRATALRVGLLVGAGDYTDRLTWWARRIDEAGQGDDADPDGGGAGRRVPAPGPPSRPVQIIDARDAARFALLCAEERRGGVWNVTGRPMPLSHLLDALVHAAGSKAEIVWVDERAVLDAGVEPWTDLPLMAPAGPAFRGFLEVDVERAHAAGLAIRPLEDTLRPLLEWDRGRRDRPLRGGLTREQEAALLG